MFTEEEFLKELAKLGTIVEEPREYRFHYDDTGGIYMCTMQNHPENTKYLVVDEATYLDYYKYQVVEGKLKLIDRDPVYRIQLKSSTQGYAVVKGHAGILVEAGEEYKDIEYYDTNN